MSDKKSEIGDGASADQESDICNLRSGMWGQILKPIAIDPSGIRDWGTGNREQGTGKREHRERVPGNGDWGLERREIGKRNIHIKSIYYLFYRNLPNSNEGNE